MTDQPAEYRRAVSDMHDAYERGIRAFAEWFAAEWQTTREEWIKSYDSKPPKREWFDGFNAGVDSVLGAVDGFLGDYHP